MMIFGKSRSLSISPSPLCEAVAIPLPHLMEEFRGWNSQLSEGRHTGHVQSLPTFPATRDYCLLDRDRYLCVTRCKHSYPLGKTSQLWRLSKITGLSEPLFSFRRAVCTEYNFLPAFKYPTSSKNNCILWFWNVWKLLPIHITLDPNFPQNRWETEKSF